MHILKERHGRSDGRLSNVESGKVCEPIEGRCEPSTRQTKAIAPQGGPLTPWQILCTVIFASRAGVRIAPKGENGFGKVGERGRLAQAGIDLRLLSLLGVGGISCKLGSTQEPSSAAPRFPMATVGHPGGSIKLTPGKAEMIGVMPFGNDPESLVGKYEVTALPLECGVRFFASYQPVNLAAKLL